MSVGPGVCWPSQRMRPSPLARPPTQILDLFDRLRDQHRTVAARTSALHGTCERLVAERSRLEELAGAIRAKLAYFDELEAVAAQVPAACWHAAGSVVWGSSAWRSSRRRRCSQLPPQAP